MEKYQPYSNGCHTVRITLQFGEYLGHIAYRVGGNCKGMDIMENPFERHTQDNIDLYSENDCKLMFDEDNESYSCILTNGNGDEVYVAGDDRIMRNITVAMEIVAYEPEADSETEE